MKNLRLTLLHEERDMWWFIEQGIYWGIFLESPNDLIDISYEDIYLEVLA